MQNEPVYFALWLTTADCKCRLNNKGIGLAIHPKAKGCFILSGLMTLTRQWGFLSSVVALFITVGLVQEEQLHPNPPSIAVCCFYPISFWCPTRLGKLSAANSVNGITLGGGLGGGLGAGSHSCLVAVVPCSRSPSRSGSILSDGSGKPSSSRSSLQKVMAPQKAAKEEGRKRNGEECSLWSHPHSQQGPWKQLLVPSAAPGHIVWGSFCFPFASPDPKKHHSVCSGCGSFFLQVFLQFCFPPFFLFFLEYQ